MRGSGTRFSGDQGPVDDSTCPAAVRDLGPGEPTVRAVWCAVLVLFKNFLILDIPVFYFYLIIIIQS